jgi:poly(beta-D-mannuronate) C5 epimerase
MLIVLAAAGSVSPAAALPTDPDTLQEASVAELAAAASEGILAGDRASAVADKQKAYRGARDVFRQLQQIAAQTGMIRPDQRPEDARAALADFAASGMTSDVLALHDFAWSLAAFSATDAASEQSVGDLVDLDMIVRDMSDPRYRVAAFVDLGRAELQRKADARVRRYVKLALAEIQSVASADDRTAGTLAVLRLITDAGPQSYQGAAEQVITLIPAAAARARASSDVARAMASEADRGLDAAALGGKAQAALAGGDVGGAALLALAMPVKDDLRGNLLEDIFKAALQQADYDLAGRVALGINGEATQGKAFRRIVGAAVERGKPLQVVDIPAEITAPRERALSFLDLGRALAGHGYRQMAVQEFNAAITAAKAVAEPDERAKALAAIAKAAADAGFNDLAESLARQLGKAAPSSTGAAIGAAYARAGNEAAALRWFAGLTGDEDRALVLVSLGNAALGRGDRIGAARWAAAIGAAKDAAPLLRAIAAAALQAGDGEAYAAMIARLPAGLDRIAALAANIGLPGVRPEWKDAVAAEIAKLPEAERSSAYAILAGALARSGDSLGALSLVAAAKGAGGDAILAAIARAETDRGNTAAALGLAAKVFDPARSAQLIADASIAEAARGGLAAAAERTRGLADYRDRVRAFRTMAEAAAGRNDVYGVLRPQSAPPAKVAEPPAGVAETAAPGAAVPVELDGTEQVRIFRLDGVTGRDRAPRLPDLAIHAADIRARVPPLEAGITDLSLARLNRFNAKFFEDIVGTSARDYLFNAQNNINPTYVFLSKGTFTLGQVAAQLSDSLGWEIGREGDAFILRVPLVIGPYATLILSGDEASEFRLSASRGAFLVNAGRLYITDTELIAYDETTKGPAFLDYEHKTRFRPFITSWSDSETYIAGARLVGFGYGAGKTYGLSFTSGPRDIIAFRDDSKPPAGILVDSSFEQMLYGFYSFEAAGISVIGNEYRNNIVYGIDPHDRSKDLRIAFNTAYGSTKKHGLIVSREVDDSFIVGNLSFANRGSGIMLDRSSIGNVVYANTAFGNEQDGVTLFESSCNAIVGNDLVNNRRGGVKIRNSADVTLFRNRIGNNDGAGIEGYVTRLETMKDSEQRDFKLDPYQPITTFSAGWNAIRANGVGITLSDANAASFVGNTFIDQLPKLYGGDLKAMRIRMLGFGAGDAPVLVTGKCPPAPAAKACGLIKDGVVPDTTRAFFAGNGGGLCVSAAGAPAAAKETN